VFAINELLQSVAKGKVPFSETFTERHGIVEEMTSAVGIIQQARLYFSCMQLYVDVAIQAITDRGICESKPQFMRVLIEA
jgi:hypothetical protein